MHSLSLLPWNQYWNIELTYVYLPGNAVLIKVTDEILAAFDVALSETNELS